MKKIIIYSVLSFALLLPNIGFAENICIPKILNIVSNTDIEIEGGEGSVETFKSLNWLEIPGAKWIWNSEYVNNPNQNEEVVFIKNINLSNIVNTAEIDILGDDYYEILVNDNQVASEFGEGNFSMIKNFDIKPYLESGENIIKIKATNAKYFYTDMGTSENNPGGISFKIDIETGECTTEEYTCTPTNNGIEIVDDIDNDCDGEVDEQENPTDICPNITGIQTEGTCVDALCLTPNTWNTEDQTCDEPKKEERHHSSGIVRRPEGRVLGASTSCLPYLNSYIEYGNKNNDKDEVKKLQEFLNEYLGLKLKVDGVYGKGSFEAVKAFQAKHGDEVLSPWIKLGSIKENSKGTGYVFKTTQWKINSLKCPDEVIPVPAL